MTGFIVNALQHLFFPIPFITLFSEDDGFQYVCPDPSALVQSPVIFQLEMHLMTEHIGRLENGIIKPSVLEGMQ